jgi:hypothetical protein
MRSTLWASGVVLALAVSSCGGSVNPTAKTSPASTPSPSVSPTAAALDASGGADLFRGTPAEHWGSDAAAFGQVTGPAAGAPLTKQAVTYARSILVAGNLTPAAIAGDTGDLLRMLRSGDQSFLGKEFYRHDYQRLTAASGFALGTKVLGLPRIKGGFTANSARGVVVLVWRGLVLYPVQTAAGRGLVPIWRQFTWIWQNSADDAPLESINVEYNHADACATRSAGLFVPEHLNEPVPARYYRANAAQLSDFRSKGYVDADGDGLDDRVHCA